MPWDSGWMDSLRDSGLDALGKREAVSGFLRRGGKGDGRHQRVFADCPGKGQAEHEGRKTGGYAGGTADL